MTYRYPILSAIGLSAARWGVFFGLTAAILSFSRAAQIAQPARGQSTGNRPEAAVAAQRDGQRLLQEARRSLERHASISAKVRVEGELYGKRFVGLGTWLQGAPKSHFLRYELKVDLAERELALQQVCDGKFLWRHRRFDDVPVLGRIDVERALSAAPPTLPSPGLGGLSRLLEGLDLAFQFEGVVEGRLRSTDVWVLRGHWRRDRLARLAPDQKAELDAGKPPRLEKLPPALPDHVIVLLGRDDLFPHRIEYCRTKPDDKDSPKNEPSPGESSKTISKIEFLEPQYDTPVDPRLFHFEPGDLQPIDETDLYIQSIQAAV